MEEDNKVKYLVKINNLIKKGAVQIPYVNINFSLMEIISAYEIINANYETQCYQQKVKNLENLVKNALIHIDPNLKNSLPLALGRMPFRQDIP